MHKKRESEGGDYAAKRLWCHLAKSLDRSVFPTGHWVAWLCPMTPSGQTHHQPPPNFSKSVSAPFPSQSRTRTTVPNPQLVPLAKPSENLGPVPRLHSLPGLEQLPVSRQLPPLLLLLLPLSPPSPPPPGSLPFLQGCMLKIPTPPVIALLTEEVSREQG